MAEEIQTLKLADIRTDAGTQSRAGINFGTVGEYADAMKEGEEFDAIEVYFDGTSYFVVDGFHRIAAAKQAGRETIEAKVINGTLREAILYSKGVNGKHGLQRSVADKQYAVTGMLQDPEWVNWSDNEIARRCKVSAPMVASLRRKLYPVTIKVYSDKARTYTTKSGKTASMNTANIGKSNGATHYTPKENDGYVPDVPESQVDEPTPATNRPSSLPPSPAVNPIPQRGSGVVSPAAPYVTRNGGDPMAGAQPQPRNGQKPYIPEELGDTPWRAVADGDYWNVEDARGHVILTGKIPGIPGRVIATTAVIGANTNAHENEPKGAPEDKSAVSQASVEVLPMVANLGTAAKLDTQETTALVKKYSPEEARAALMLITFQKNLPPSPRDLVADLIEMVRNCSKVEKKAKKEKPASTPAEVFIPMKDAILEAFGWEVKDITKSKWGEIQNAAKQLCEVNCDPATVRYGVAYCKSKFDNFGPLAVAKEYASWKKTIPQTPAAPDESEYVPMPESARKALHDLYATFGIQSS